MRKKKAERAENRLQLWQQRLQTARQEYQDTLADMRTWNEYYNGTREVQRDPNTHQQVSRKSSNVRNIVYELIESQVDATIPAPRVDPIHEEDRDLAKSIEAVLRFEVLNLQLAMLNDKQERTTPISGASMWLIEWDPKAGTHCTLGDVHVSDLHPKQVIPQPGVYEVDEMDYLFVQMAQTKQYIKRRYGVDVEAAGEEEPSVRGEDGALANMVTQNIAYYRNERGGIGMFSWVDDYVLVDMDDYQARRLEVCRKCGLPKSECECEDPDFELKAVYDQELPEGVTEFDLYSGEEDVEILDVNGQPVFDEQGIPMTQSVAVRTKVPYYNPGMFPVIVRRNVSKADTFIGASDVAPVMDQQDAIKKFGAKIDEKILKGGSYVTLPQGIKIETNDKELKIIRLKNPADKALIGVINVQPDVSKEMTSLEQNYQWAKSTLGITDSFQGKYDASATSGTAKQFSANQAAGRLQSKREQKNHAFAELYKAIFRYLLAYSDQPIAYSVRQPDGSVMFAHFNRWDFLKQDAAGEFYWDDEFIFTVDPSANIATQRSNLWDMIDVKYQAGAFGPISDNETNVRLWTLLENMQYPYAGTMRDMFEAAIEKEEEQLNAVSAMQSGDALQQPV